MSSESMKNAEKMEHDAEGWMKLQLDVASSNDDLLAMLKSSSKTHN